MINYFRILKKIIFFALVFGFFCTAIEVSYAQKQTAQAGSREKAVSDEDEAKPALSTPTAPDSQANGYILMDANSSYVIGAKNPDERMHPASLTKLMTLYLTFLSLQNGQIHLHDKAHISVKAWQTGGSRMFIKENTDVSIDDLIQGIVVDSGNDACVAMAQHIAGTEEAFVQLMNVAAKRLNMVNTHFVDATGLPDPGQYSTPRDLALLAQALISDFPQYYHFFSQKWFTYGNIKQSNRNHLLWRDPSVDGLKTGYTQDAGYCLITSAMRNGMRLITVMMGSPTIKARTDESQALLNYGFRFYETHQLFPGLTALSKQQRVWFGNKKYVDFGVKQTLYVTVPINQAKDIKATLSLKRYLKAPIVKGKPYGTVDVLLNNQTIRQVPLVALQNSQPGGWWSRTRDHILSLFHRG